MHIMSSSTSSCVYSYSFVWFLLCVYMCIYILHVYVHIRTYYVHMLMLSIHTCMFSGAAGSSQLVPYVAYKEQGFG